MHRLPCIRTKLADVVFYSPYDQGITKRWDRPEAMADLRGWASNEVAEIHIMMRGVCTVPMTVRVREFKPREGDQVHYKWLNDANGKKKETFLRPFALSSINEARRCFVDYVEAYAVRSWEEQARRGDTHRVILDHYQQTLEYYNSLDEYSMDRRVLLNFFKMRLALRKYVRVLFSVSFLYLSPGYLSVSAQ